LPAEIAERSFFRQPSLAEAFKHVRRLGGLSFARSTT
jgi:hypothetical protein